MMIAKMMNEQFDVKNKKQHIIQENKIICVDALDGLRSLPDHSIAMCVTSPPYYGLRNYEMNGQIGIENSPAEYIARLVSVFQEVRRVLNETGTLWVNIADSYAGSGKGLSSIPEKTTFWQWNNRSSCQTSRSTFHRD